MPSKTKAAGTGAVVSEDAIRQRAYYLWEADGRPEGNSDHYWKLASHEATAALVQQSSDGAAKAMKGKTPGDLPDLVKASKATKARVKSAEAGKPAKKAPPKPRAAVQKAK